MSEENKEIQNNIEKDTSADEQITDEEFVDFEDEENIMPELDSDLIEMDEKQEISEESYDYELELKQANDDIDACKELLKQIQAAGMMPIDDNNVDVPLEFQNNQQETISEEEQLIEQKKFLEEEQKELKTHEISENPFDEIFEIKNNHTENIENDNINPKQDNIQENEFSKWEELSEDNNVVKKYIVYISKEYVPYIDKLSIDERNAYINDAIQIKVDTETLQKQSNFKKQAILHTVIAILTFIIMTPILLLAVNKAIMVTFENYKYSQDNFEKLYKQRFEKDRAYMRSIEYNKEHKKNQKEDK